MRLIPAIDLLHGRCVRLHQGDFAEVTEYPATPVELAARYRGVGATWLHVVDLDGARSGEPLQHASLRALAEIDGIKVQLGGGVRRARTLAELFAAGVARAVVGSAAVESPQEVAAWIGAFGAERICVALDVRIGADGLPRVRTRGWTRDAGVSLWSALEPLLGSGLKHVLCTDIARDGAARGPNLALYTQACRRFPQLEWQASGGIRDAADLAALAALIDTQGAGPAAAVSGRALLDGRISPTELAPFLHDA